MPTVFGKNPVLEALKTDQPIDKIFIQNGKEGFVVNQIYRVASNKQIPVVRADRKKLIKMSKNRNHQGILALISPVNYVPLANLIDKIHFSGETARLLILDGIQDPHNFGAIIRTAEVFGIHGLIFSYKNSVLLTDTVVKTSAGAVFHLDICKVESLVKALTYIKNCGILIYSTSSKCENTLWSVDFTQPHAVIIGSEGSGIKSSLYKNSDVIFGIPQQGNIDSLNVSVSAGIILAEVQRQLQFTIQ
jgi:23S rRNA (guanosine2251-2'-O)-methyltransferase